MHNWQPQHGSEQSW